ncbi:MAG: hypothetical protein B6226_05750 [Candidatus Cloacimonetes bacterium 4572_65]|nr:MAG: hypothetical protein B6226_05750 [Candidatus Cloacimonetes bacterium 4572_65]
MTKKILSRKNIKDILDNEENPYYKLVEFSLFIIIILSVATILFEMLIDANSTLGSIVLKVNRIFLYFFILEYTIRLWSHSKDIRSLLSFIIRPFSIIDLLCILPVFRVFRSIRLFKLLRVLRIVKLGKYKANIGVLFESITTFLSVNNVQILLLTGVIVFITLATSLILKFITPDISMFKAMWWALIRVIDPGFIETGGGTSIAELMLSLVVSIFGVVIFGLFIGLSSNLFMQYFEMMQYKKRTLNIKNHHLLCNWGNDLMMRQLVEELRYHNGKAAILAEKDDLEILDNFSPGAYHFRYGDSTVTHDLQNKGSALTASTIVIFSDKSNEVNRKNADNRTLLTLLVLKQIFDTREKELLSKKFRDATLKEKQAELRNKTIIVESESTELDKLIGNKIMRKDGSNSERDNKTLSNIILIQKKKLIAQLLVQSGLNIHLSAIYSELFTHFGQEIDVLNAKDIFDKHNIKENITFIKLVDIMMGSGNKKRKYGVKNSNKQPLLIGYIRNNNVIFNPNPNDSDAKRYTLFQDDKLVVLADISKVSNNSDKQHYTPINKIKIAPNRNPKNLLITGWNSSVNDLIGEAISYGMNRIYILAENFNKIIGSKNEYCIDETIVQKEIIVEDVVILDNQEVLGNKQHFKARDLVQNEISVTYIKGDPCLSYIVEEVTESVKFDLFISVADSTSTSNRSNSDSRTINTLFHLDKASATSRDRYKVPIPIVTELLHKNNQSHASNAGANSIVVSPLSVGNYITQISRKREIKDIFNQLLSISGKEIYTIKFTSIQESLSNLDRLSFSEIHSVLYNNTRILLIGIVLKKNSEILLNPGNNITFESTECAGKNCENCGKKICTDIDEVIVICKSNTAKEINAQKMRRAI